VSGQRNSLQTRLLTELCRWENRVGDEAIKWLWMFCESHEQQVVERAEALQPIACATVLADFSDCHSDPQELREEGHVFSRHFRQTGHWQDRPTGLQALVAAADVAVEGQMRSNDSDIMNDGLTDAPTQMLTSNQNAVTNAGVFSEGTGDRQVQAPGTPETASVPTALYGQAAQPQWQMYADQTNPQQTIPQHNSLYGAQSLPQYNFAHAGMTTMAPQFLPDNGLDGVYHGVVGNGHSTNDEWDRLDQELFTRYGYFTSQS
jgi:hypothetical protein